jgi:hypothetical protein
MLFEPPGRSSSLPPRAGVPIVVGKRTRQDLCLRQDGKFSEEDINGFEKRSFIMSLFPLLLAEQDFAFFIHSSE